jgi:hypothetical protein
VMMMETDSRGASNAKAKRELGWELRYPSWRQGFVAAYAATAPSDRANRIPRPDRGSHRPKRLRRDRKMQAVSTELLRRTTLRPVVCTAARLG